MALINEQYRTPLIILVVIVLAAFAYFFFVDRGDDRSSTERLGDALQELPEGPGKAARELQDRTPAERLNDAIKDQGDKLKENAPPSNEP